MVAKHCCYGICNSDSRYSHRPHMQGVRFIYFPQPGNDPQKCAKWVKACGRPNEVKKRPFTVKSVNNNTYICTKHFMGGQGPTAEYPDPVPAFASDVELEAFRRRKKRKPPTKRLSTEIPIGNGCSKNNVMKSITSTACAGHKHIGPTNITPFYSTSDFSVLHVSGLKPDVPRCEQNTEVKPQPTEPSSSTQQKMELSVSTPPKQNSPKLLRYTLLMEPELKKLTMKSTLAQTDLTCTTIVKIAMNETSVGKVTERVAHWMRKETQNVRAKMTDEGECSDKPDQKRIIIVTEEPLVERWLRVGTLENLTQDSDIAQFLLALYFSGDKNSSDKLKPTSHSSCNFCLLPMWKCLNCQRNVSQGPGQQSTGSDEQATVDRIKQNPAEQNSLTPLLPAKNSRSPQAKVVDTGVNQNIVLLNIGSKNRTGEAQCVSNSLGLNKETSGFNPAQIHTNVIPITVRQNKLRSVQLILPPNVKLSPNFVSLPNKTVFLQDKINTSLPLSEGDCQSIALLNVTSKNRSDQTQIGSNNLSIHQKTAGVNLPQSDFILSTVCQNNTTLPQSEVINPLTSKKETSTSSLPQKEKTNTGTLLCKKLAMETQFYLDGDKKPVFVQQEQLKHHREKFRKNNSQEHPKRARCIFCKKTFCNVTYAQHHMLSQHMQPRFTCEICSKLCTSREMLNSHLRRHTGQRSYLCEICGKGFYSSQTLNRHIKIHLGHKPHICKECGKAFMLSKSLVSHMLTHTKVKKFVCDICGKAFGWAANMRTHRQRHANATIQTKQRASEQNIEMKFDYI